MTVQLLLCSAKHVPVAYGIKKLQISCVVEDDKVGTDFLEEAITAFEEHVSRFVIILIPTYFIILCRFRVWTLWPLTKFKSLWTQRRTLPYKRIIVNIILTIICLVLHQ